MLTTTDELICFLKQLDSRKISYSISRYINDSISIIVVVPGERWEIDVDHDGEIQIEIFKSDGTIYDSNKIEYLFEQFTD
jgi:hypothetical protein